MDGNERAAARPAFFWLRDELFLNVGYDFGAFRPTRARELATLVEEARPDELLIGRRLRAGERRRVARDLADAHADVFGRFVPRDDARWRPG